MKYQGALLWIFLSYEQYKMCEEARYVRGGWKWVRKNVKYAIHSIDYFSSHSNEQITPSDLSHFVI